VVVWEVLPYNLIGTHPRFRGTFFLQLLGTLKEPVHSSETLAYFYQTTRHHILVDVTFIYIAVSTSRLNKQVYTDNYRENHLNYSLLQRNYLLRICDKYLAEQSPSSNNVLLLFFFYVLGARDRLCGIVVRVPGYRSRSPGLDSRRCQIL
jgi:hypothetical protein